MSNNGDPRALLYEKLALIEDYLASGIRSGTTVPELLPERPDSAAVNAGVATNRVASSIQNQDEKSGTGTKQAGVNREPGAKGTIPVTSISLPELSLACTPPENDGLEKIARECADCRACRLFANRNGALAGSFPRNPKLVIITDTPSTEDDKAAKLFSGEQGALLEKMLEAIGLSAQQDIAVLPLTKCRTPEREPAPDEAMHCSPFVLRQLCLIKSPILLAFGRVAAQCVTGKPRESLAALRNTVHSIKIFSERKVICTYHPREILTNTALKRPVWEDLKLLQSVL